MNVREAAAVIGCCVRNVQHLLKKEILVGERKLTKPVEKGGTVVWAIDPKSVRKYAKTVRKGGYPRGIPKSKYK